MRAALEAQASVVAQLLRLLDAKFRRQLDQERALRLQEEHKHQAALFHHAAAERSSNLFHGAVDSKHFMTAAGAQIPPPMQYMGMPHLSNWQLAAH